MKLVVAGGDAPLRSRVEDLFRCRGYAVDDVESLDALSPALASTRPDALLLLTGSDTTAILEFLSTTGWAQRVPTVLLSRERDIEVLLRSVVVGARALLLETDALEALLVAVDAAARGGSPAASECADSGVATGEPAWDTAEVFDALLDGRLGFCAEARQSGELQLVLEERDGSAALDDRERSVVERLVAGVPLKAIAMDLGLALSSTWGLLDSGRAKMRFRDRCELLKVLSALRP